MFSTWGALTGLVVAIVLITRKTAPAYALVFGALVGGLVGGGGLADTVSAMISGTQSMMPSVLRILTSGVLVGALVKTGSAERLADSIVRLCGTRFTLAAVAAAAMLVTAVGVFVDIAVITVAPVALAAGRRADIGAPALLLAMVGGGKAGNIISPNPNTIATADAFRTDMTSLMAANIVPALVALVVAAVLATWLARRGAECGARGEKVKGEEVKGTVECGVRSTETGVLPPVWAALLGPVVVVALLALRPFAGVEIDPLVALPAGGLVSVVVCSRARHVVGDVEYGLSKVAGVAILLIGTGAVAGIIKASGLNADMIALLKAFHLPAFALAPVSGLLLAGATASTTAGATIASQTFAGALAEAGVPAVYAGAMMHAGCTVLDALPHGSFFHATGGAAGLSVKENFKVFPLGALVGLASTLSAIAVYLVCG